MTPDIEQENRTTRDREMNRLRVQRYRERTAKNVTRPRARGNGSGNGVMVDCNGQPSRRMTAVAKALVDGMSDYKALRSQGYPGNSTQVTDQVRTQLEQEAQALGISTMRYLKNIVRRDEATKLVFTQDGSIDVPDWSAQKDSARDQEKVLQALKKLPKDDTTQGSGSFSLVLQSLNVTLDLVDTHADNEAITSEACKLLNP
jgi:hypothetical protein